MKKNPANQHFSDLFLSSGYFFLACLGVSSLRLPSRILTLMLALLCLSCERPLENPELSDNIYNDLIKDAKTSAAAVEEEKKTLAGLEEDIVATKLGDNSGKSKFRKKYDTENKIQMLKQKVLYYNLRAAKRKEYVANTYPSYFSKKMHWPDAEEWANYQASKRLSVASRDWNHRVPKLSKRIKAYSDSANSTYSKSKKDESQKKEGGEKPAKSEAPPKH